MSNRETLIRLNVGCGLNPAPGYINLDNSPSLIIQKNFLLRALARVAELSGHKVYTRFPKGVRRFDITKRLPFTTSSVSVIYSSHMLEHLPRLQAELFLREGHRVLAQGGILRLVLPDLEQKARDYLKALEAPLEPGSIPSDSFIRGTYLGADGRKGSQHPIARIRNLVSPDAHLWMWDAKSLGILLQKIGFQNVERKTFGQSTIAEIDLLDIERRKEESFYIEAQK